MKGKNSSGNCSSAQCWPKHLPCLAASWCTAKRRVTSVPSAHVDLDTRATPLGQATAARE
eukprot:2496321-Amphidinium_carterae.2